MNIYQKINEIRKAVIYIQKDKSVSTGGGSYKAVTHDAVTGRIRDHLIQHGVVCVPTLVASHSDPREENSKQFRYVATYSFDFVNAEMPAEKVTIVIEAHAMDNADKAPGKALSYAKKYAVLKLFEIETGEDEESRFGEEPTGISDAQFQNFKSMIEAHITKSAAKAEWQKAVLVCNAAKDVESANKLKAVLLEHGLFIDKAAA